MVNLKTTMSQKEYIEYVRSLSKSKSKLLSCKRFGKYTIDNSSLPQDIKDKLNIFIKSNYVDKGIGLYLWSESPGSGKTTIMNYILNQYVDKGYRVYFNSLIEIKNRLKDEFADDSRIPQFLDNLKQFDIVGIDDIGSEVRSSWLDEVIKDLVDDRYNNEKPIFLTSNYDLNNLPLHNKIIDRLRSMVVPIHFPEQSFRKLGI